MPDDEDAPVLDSSKVYKVKYSINMLTLLGEYIEDKDGKISFVNKDMSLIDLCIQNELIDVFESENFIELIMFKWKAFAKKLHMVGFFFHLFYVALLMVYVNFVYILCIYKYNKIFEILLGLAVLYPAWYDTSQLCK